MKPTKVRPRQQGAQDAAVKARPKRPYSIMPGPMRHPEMVFRTEQPPEDAQNPQEYKPASIPPVRDSAAPHQGDPGPRGAPRRPRFEDRFARVTTYVENGLHDRLREFVAQPRDGEYPTITQVVNRALREYLDSH